MSRQLQIMQAIQIHDKIKMGLFERDWVDEQVLIMAREGMWNNSHIASIICFSRSYVFQLLAKNNVTRKPYLNGTLAVSSLDALLSLTGDVAGKERNTYIRAAITAGTSTRLIAAITNTPIGVVLYQQRKMKEEAAHG